MGHGEPVDVVVVTWNTRELTVAALRRLVAADPAGRLRLVVHDNASADGTPEAIRAALPGVDVAVSATNLGFAAGVNRALARTSAPWLLLLNSDAWPEPGAVEALLECAGRHPRAAAVVPRLLRPDGELELSSWPLPSLQVAAASAVRPVRYAWAHDAERRVDWAVGAAWLLRRAALDAIGPLDESLFMYGEDVDWCWRAADAGWEVWLAPDAVVRHVGNASGEQRYGEARAAAWINNAVRVYRRRHGTLATAAWQVTNAAGALLAARRARRAADADLARDWRRQARAWLRRPHPDSTGHAGGARSAV